MSEYVVKASKGSFNRIMIKNPVEEDVNIQYTEMEVYDKGIKFDTIPAQAIGEGNYRIDLIVDDKYNNSEYCGKIKGTVNGRTITRDIKIELDSPIEIENHKASLIQQENFGVHDDTLPPEMQNWS